MTISRLTIVLLVISVLSCTNQKSTDKVDSNSETKSIEYPDIYAIQTEFPLRLDKLNLNDSSEFCHLSDGKVTRIENEIRKFYFNDCSGDSSEVHFKLKETYVGTILLKDSIVSIYMVILDRPAGLVTSKILFFDNLKNDFINQQIDFNIHALYNRIDDKLKPSNLKTKFMTETPEIEITDFDGDGINEFKFTRLFHNGTANAIEYLTIKILDNSIDTLEFVKDWK